MFVLQSGLMAVSVDGNEVAVVKSGGVVGELALLYSEPRAASVEAVSKCTLWSLVSEGPCHAIPCNLTSLTEIIQPTPTRINYGGHRTLHYAHAH
jgi:hypothetical protein